MVRTNHGRHQKAPSQKLSEEYLARALVQHSSPKPFEMLMLPQTYIMTSSNKIKFRYKKRRNWPHWLLRERERELQVLTMISSYYMDCHNMKYLYEWTYQSRSDQSDYQVQMKPLLIINFGKSCLCFMCCIQNY